MSVLGIDIGSFTTVLSTIKSGTVHIVLNDLSDRSTPSVIGFKDCERLFGDTALSTLASNYMNTCRHMKMIMGHPLNPTELEYSFCKMVNGHSGNAAYEVFYNNEYRVFESVSVLASFLKCISVQASGYLGHTCVDVVISVPPWYDHRSRIAVQQACHVAGLNCIRLMNEDVATSLSYGIYRAKSFPEDASHRCAFINFGHSSSHISIADFTRDGVGMVHTSHDIYLGCRDVDRLLVYNWAQWFLKKYNVNPLTNKKAFMKLSILAEKIRKVLSANSEAAVSVECLVEDWDLDLIQTREQVEEMCVELKLRFSNMISNAIAATGYMPIDNVELIGGGTRIPWVYTCIRDILESIGSGIYKECPISRTINGDECVSQGCALQGAMLLPRYRVKEYVISDLMKKPVLVSWTSNQVDSIECYDGRQIHIDKSSVGWREFVLFDTATSVPKYTNMTLHNPTDLEVNLYELKSEIERVTLGHYLFDINGSLKQLLGQGKVVGSFRVIVELMVDSNCLVVVSGCHLVFEEIIKEQVKVSKNKPPLDENLAQNSVHPPSPDLQSETSETRDVTMTAAKSDNESDLTNVEKTPEETEPVDNTIEYDLIENTKTVSVRHPVEYKSEDIEGVLSESRLKALVDLELQLYADDRESKEVKEVRNALESYLYEMKDWVNDVVNCQYLPPENIQSYKGMLDDTIDWIYRDNNNHQKEALKDKLQRLQSIGDSAKSRQRNDTEVVHELERLTADIERETTKMGGLEDEFGTMCEIGVAKVRECLLKLESFLDDKVVQFQNHPKHKEPILTNRMIRDQFQEYLNLRKTHCNTKDVEPQPTPSQT